MTTARQPLSDDTPEKLLSEYREASLILACSPKASAALSRRCLQSLLDEKLGAKKPDLMEQIEEVLRSPMLPPYLAEELRRVKEICNFTACPVKTSTPGEIVDVEPEEAEKLLEILEKIIDFYLAGPAKKKMPRVAFTEEELIKPGSLETVRILANGIAHDFNNLLTAIVGNVALARLSMTYEEVVLDKLEKAEEIAGHARDLIKQLFLFARGGDPLCKEMSVVDVVEDSARVVLANSDIKWDLTVPDDLRPVYADQGQLGQVFRNMLVNAREAMPQGGRIGIIVRNVAAHEVRGLLPEAKEYVKVSIGDRGCGIPRQQVLQIFNPYFTTKEVGSRRGTGLGLSMSYAIIRKHGGYVSVDSQEGLGTTFHIYVPALSREKSNELAAKTECCPAKARVLVIEGEEMVRRSITERLDALGYETVAAGNGVEGIGFYRDAKNRGEPFDSVIIDLAIPQGLGAADTLKELLAIEPALRAVLSSGHSADPLMADFTKEGFGGFVAKPYHISELDEILRRVITR